MSAKVFVWSRKDGNLGHGSLELSDGTYISWLPSNTLTKTEDLLGQNRPDLLRSLETDVAEEGRQPDKVYVLPSELGLKEDQTKTWWNGMKTHEKYNLLQNNCCTVVKCALEAGGLKSVDDLVEKPDSLIGYIEYLISEEFCGFLKKAAKKKMY